MEYPIVEVKTKDNLILNGILFKDSKCKKIIINIHGTASNFYDEPFIKPMALEFPKIGYSFLSTNNRGNSVLTHTWQKCGSAVERFEDCLIDIDTWIEFVLEMGYSEIILQGHSLGTEKIVYYMNNGKYKNKIKLIILLGFSESYGNGIKFMEKTNSKNKLFEEAKRLIKEGRGEQFLTTKWYSHAGLLPKSAESFLNQF